MASVLPDRDDLLFFASGVSNSLEIHENEFRREYELLRRQNTKKHIVYFSTLSLFYNKSRYTMHKKQMEMLVSSCFNSYTIIRIGNIAWGKNPHTFINAYKLNPYPIKDEYRYVVNQEEFLYWISLIPAWNCEMNIPGERMKIADALRKYGNS